nr:family 43 glycosylhydrolase [Nannocystis sp. SCPEA4]
MRPSTRPPKADENRRVLVLAALVLACDGDPSDPLTNDTASTGDVTQEPGLVWLEGQNPVLPIGHPDPGVLRVAGPDGVTYHLTSTVDNAGDFPRFTSTDLIVWTDAGRGLFGRTNAPGRSLALHGAHYCSRWAPEIVQLGAESFMLSFTAQRFAAPQSPCPPYDEDSGIYLAWSPSPEGPFTRADRPWEPWPAGADCPLRPVLPHSLDFASDDCQGTYCHHIMRLDSTVFHDPQTGRWWLAYSWYTDSPPKDAWELANHGQHVHLVELDPNDPFAVRCDLAVAQIYAGNPHDAETLARLAASCPGCDRMLSMTRGPLGEEMLRDGVSLGVVEAPSLFRRGEYVYLLLSGSNWDSPYYHVYWVAATSVEGLVYTDPARLVGRFLIPGDGQAFGHGSAVLGPDGERWYFVHHRLQHVPCEESGCARDVWVSPIEFDDRGDGLGEVHIRPRWPAQDPSFTVAVPTGERRAPNLARPVAGAPRSLRTDDRADAHAHGPT